MNLLNAMRLHLSSDGMGPGAVGVSVPNGGVISPSMKKMGGLTQVAADASPSDLASHHLWREPSSTDTTIRNWRAQRVMEKRLGRGMDPFETQANFMMLTKLGNL